MQNSLFDFEPEPGATPPKASRTRAQNADAGVTETPTFALFQTRANRWTSQTQTFDADAAQAANAWFSNRELPLTWRPIADRKTYVIRR